MYSFVGNCESFLLSCGLWKRLRQKKSQQTTFTKDYITLNNLIAHGPGLNRIVVSFQFLEVKMNHLYATMSDYFNKMFETDTSTSKDVDKENGESDIHKEMLFSVKYRVNQHTSSTSAPLVDRANPNVVLENTGSDSNIMHQPYK